MITVLTDPVTMMHNGSFPFIDWWNNAVQKLVGQGRTRTEYGGHAGVTRSLVEGLRGLGIPHDYNPSTLSQVGQTVAVLSGIKPLLQAIELKRTGRIQTLLVGPNLVVRSNEHDCIVTAPEVDICIVPSDWVRTAYLEDTPLLEDRIRVWAAGVDHRFWSNRRKPAHARQVLLYQKNCSTELSQSVRSLLASMGWNPVTLVYGEYVPSQYRRLLRTCAFAVFLSRSESQGLALAEAWAMDVPTFVWDPAELTLDGRWYSEVSSCPYLTRATGMRWKTFKEFLEMLSDVTHILPTFEPRKWVLGHMTDEAAARNFMDIVAKTTLREAHLL